MEHPERNVFPYFDGRESRHGDPLALLRGVRVRLGGDPGKVIDVIDAGNHPGADGPAVLAACAAAERLVGAVREAFQLAPFDPKTGAGATEEVTLAVWDQFCAFLEKKNRSAATPPTSPQPSASSPSGSTTAPSSA